MEVVLNSLNQEFLTIIKTFKLLGVFWGCRGGMGVVQYVLVFKTAELKNLNTKKEEKISQH